MSIKQLKCCLVCDAGLQADPQARDNGQPGSKHGAPLGASPQAEDKSSGYVTDVEDEARGGPKGDLQSHISRSFTQEVPGAQAVVSNVQAASPDKQSSAEQAEAGWAEQKLEARDQQTVESPKQQDEASGKGKVAEWEGPQPARGRRIKLEGQVAGTKEDARVATAEETARQLRGSFQEAAACTGGTVLLTGEAALPVQPAAWSVPVGGPAAAPEASSSAVGVMNIWEGQGVEPSSGAEASGGERYKGGAMRSIKECVSPERSKEKVHEQIERERAAEPAGFSQAFRIDAGAHNHDLVQCRRAVFAFTSPIYLIHDTVP